MGRSLVSMLWLQIANKTAESKVQSKATCPSGGGSRLKGRIFGSKGLRVLNPPHRFGEKSVCVEGRTFSLQVLRFQNGCFASVTEGKDRLGAVVASLHNGTVSTTTQVIPAKSEALFMRLLAERLATRLNGVVLLSVNVRNISPGAAKTIMGELDAMVS